MLNPVSASLPTDDGPVLRRRRLFYKIVLAVVAGGMALFLRSTQWPWKGSGAKRAARGKEMRFEEMVEIQLWWAVAIIAGLLGLALVTSPWWMRWARIGNDSGPPTEPNKQLGYMPWRRKFTWLLAGILTVALVSRWPRMDRFMERDEQDTVRRSMIGYVPLDAAGQAAGEPVIHPWALTVWECRSANNPILYSVAARASVRAWQGMTGAEPWRVRLEALRLPALGAGLLGLGVLAWLGWLMGRPEVGLGASLLGAVHPLHVEFSTQARGYGMVLLFTPLALGWAWLALRTGRWRHWLALGGSLWALLAANPGSIYFAGALGVALTISLVLRCRRDTSGTAGMSLTRWFLAAGLAAICYLPVIWPTLPQALPYLKNFKGELDGMWVPMTWSWYAGGMCYPPMEMTEPWLAGGNTAWGFIRSGFFQTEPLTACFVLFMVPAVLWMGGCWWWRKEGGRPLLLACVAAPLMAYAVHRSAETPFLYHWYLIYWLPPALLLTAAGLWQVGQRGAAWSGRAWMALVPAGIFLAIFAAINLPGPGRISWLGFASNGPEIYIRGRYQWITHPDGITYRQLVPGRSESKAGSE